MVDPEAVAAAVAEHGEDLAGIMMTCPNTLGLMETHLPRIVELLHGVDALLYYDGANMNALLGKMRVGEAGFDGVHLHVHKTFATPHGGGGPGAGPVGVSERLLPFLPAPRVAAREDGSLFLDYNLPQSMGYMGPFYGSFGVVRVSVDLIVPAGMDIHSFEPTAKDMVTIGEADVFIYNGGTMESWVPKVLEAAEGKDITTLRMMDHVKVVDEEIVEGMQEEEHEHGHADGDHDDAEETEQDEHIWTAPLNCVKFVDEIAAAFAKADPDHSQEYLNRAEQYTAQLKDLDMQIRQIVAGAKHKEMVFGDRFPLRYFTDAYGLTYRAAFPKTEDLWSTEKSSKYAVCAKPKTYRR